LVDFLRSFVSSLLDLIPVGGERIHERCDCLLNIGALTILD
jgi:hypothetical protein